LIQSLPSQNALTRRLYTTRRDDRWQRKILYPSGHGLTPSRLPPRSSATGWRYAAPAICSRPTWPVLAVARESPLGSALGVFGASRRDTSRGGTVTSREATVSPSSVMSVPCRSRHHVRASLVTIAFVGAIHHVETGRLSWSDADASYSALHATSLFARVGRLAPLTWLRGGGVCFVLRSVFSWSCQGRPLRQSALACT